MAVARQYLESRSAEWEQGDHTQPFWQDLTWGVWPWHLFLMGKPWSAKVTPGPAQVQRFGYGWIRARHHAVFWAITVDGRDSILDPFVRRVAEAIR